MKKNNHIKRNAIQRFIAEEFANELDQIKDLRVKIGKDDLKTIKADWRLTLAMVRHPKFMIIKEDIINADLDLP